MITTSDVGQQGTAESDIEECKAERPTSGVEWVLYHCDNNPQRARTRPLDAASKERGAQQQRPTTNAAGSARRGRHPEFIENRKLNLRRLEGRGHPPPRGGARVSLVDPRPNRRAIHRKSSTEQRKNFPASPSIKIAILLLGIASEIASEILQSDLCFAEIYLQTFLSSS